MLNQFRKFTLLINSLGIFLISFFSVRISVILVKYAVADFFHIDTIISNYRILGISASDSGVWTFPSVYAFYSPEIIVPFILFIIAVCLYRINPDKSTRQRVFYLWFGFSSMQSFYAAIIAGIVTKTNTYYFFQWLYIPNYIMMLMVIALVPVIITFGWFYNREFLVTSPVKNSKSEGADQRNILLYSLLFPAILGTLLLVLPLLFSIHKYDIYDFSVLLVMILPVIFYFYPLTYHEYSRNFSRKIRYIPLFIGLAGCLIFMIINFAD
jgi:hypothetical protein